MRAYPHFQASYSHEQLVEHFLLTPADLQLVLTCGSEANRCVMALGCWGAMEQNTAFGWLATSYLVKITDPWEELHGQDRMVNRNRGRPTGARSSLSSNGNPPALPGDSQSLTVPGVPLLWI